MPTGHDIGHGSEPGAPIVHRIVSPKDAALEQATAAGLQVLTGRYSVHKYNREVAPENLYEIVECPPNLFLTQGVTKIWQLVTNAATGGTPHLDSSNAYLAVGNSSTAAAAGQSDLLGASKRRMLVNGNPVIAGHQVTFAAEYGTGDANFEWLEVGVGWATSGNTLISRSALDSPGLGTKVNTAVWVLNWTLSID